MKAKEFVDTNLVLSKKDKRKLLEKIVNDKTLDEDQKSELM